MRSSCKVREIIDHFIIVCRNGGAIFANRETWFFGDYGAGNDVNFFFDNRKSAYLRFEFPPDSVIERRNLRRHLDI